MVAEGLRLLDWRTIQRITASCFDSWRFSSATFDGQAENIGALCRESRLIPGTELAVVIDAIAVCSYVRIYIDGSADALARPLKLPKDKARNI
jgi:hypothetical protein